MDWRTVPPLFDDHAFFEAWLSGNTEAARVAAGGLQKCFDPQAGAINAADLRSLARKSQALWGPRGALYRRIARIDQPLRTVVEGVLAGVEAGQAFAIPICAVADAWPRHLRLYYTLWPLTGRHDLRPPVREPCDEAMLRDIVAEYQEALEEGDLEKLLRCFEAEGCAREPSGTPWLHCGPTGLRAFYGETLRSGGIELRHCTVTDDGVACAIEYVVTRWGETTLPPQAGVAVYERGVSGRLRAARIYDDVTPPRE